MNTLLSRRRALSLLAAGPVLFGSYARAAGRPIDESGFVQIGGIDQWIGIQGTDSAHPALLFLHGGPAEAQSPFLKTFSLWETSFTVINWDQRGSGRTYGRYGASTPGMATPAEALKQLTSDAIEVADYARRRLGQKKLILVGHSWGTILGAQVIHQRPDLFSAFVGTGMVVSWPLTVEATEQWARQEATRVGDQQTLDAVNKASSLPVTDPRRLMSGAKYRMAPADLTYLHTVQEPFLGQTPATQGPAADWVAGGQFSLPRLLPVMTAFDARVLGLRIGLPFYVIQGRDDHVVSFAAAKDYVEEIQAPRKAFVPIAGGHFACFTDAPEFVAALRRLVRPVA